VLRTRFTERFGLDHPVMSAPMALHSGGTLAGAVSAAGGLGSFGGIHVTQPPTWVGEQASLVRDQTDGSFAIGFITPFLGFTEPYLDAALDARPTAIVLSFSDPRPWAGRIRDAGCALVCQAQTFRDAELAIDAGADVVIAQGHEAGGHTGTMGLLPLLAGIAERHPDVVLLAAGGIATARGLAAALVAGADGAMLGTAFLATHEAVEVGDDHKAAIVESDGTDTVFTRAYDIASGLPWPSGIGERVRRDGFTDTWTEREAELRAQAAEISGGEAVLYGESARFVTAVEPAAAVVRRISAEAEAILRARPGAIAGDGGDTT
jgi:nitronate monooxygenase